MTEAREQRCPECGSEDRNEYRLISHGALVPCDDPWHSASFPAQPTGQTPLVNPDLLAEHWLFEMRCNQSLKVDIAFCACGWAGSSQPSVGMAAKEWARHVLLTLAGAAATGETPRRRDCDMTKGDIQCPAQLGYDGGAWSCRFVAGHPGLHKTTYDNGQEWSETPQPAGSEEEERKAVQQSLLFDGPWEPRAYEAGWLARSRQSERGKKG